MLDGVDARGGADPGAGQPGGVRGDLAAARVYRLHHPAHLVRAERGRGGVGAVQVELDEVGAVVELAERGGEQLVAVPRLHGQARRQQADRGDPGPGGAHVRPVPAALPAVADAEAERPGGGAGRIGAARGADVAGPAHAGAVLQLAVGFGHGEQAIGRVAAPVDPVRAAGQGEVAVPVDHPRHDRGAARVDDLGAAG